MSWADYTRAKHFGNGIFLPYSNLLADIAFNLDNLLSTNPILAHNITPISNRDILLVKGKRVSLLALSSNTYRHLPLFQTYEWEDFLSIDEEVFIKDYPIIIKESLVLTADNLYDFLTKNYSMLDPILIVFPSVFQASKDSVEEKIKNDITYKIAKSILNKEIKNYEEKKKMENNTEVFLSHKSNDKSLVREIASTLSSLGYSPWLDEDKMKAGANLERSIRSGFESSCAAVFFITPNFKDEGYLASEIDYAIAEKRDKGDKFVIITLLIPDHKGNYGEVPKLLKSYVWKEIEPVQAIRTIVEALPIKLSKISWKSDL
ncbi:MULTISPECIES: toll/interleukin-1 receptor domain-containing protein [unclassified Psychrobacter]|uniref:toll/interleukin-1 receptor domain-containing protein n=1 Tax=unclassified Psychrobacter TaxID=196806 RepID=UPI003F463BBC